MIATSTLATTIIAAAASLLGALIGGLTSYYVQRASSHRAAVAARLLLRYELGNARDAVYEIRREGNWPIGWQRDWTSAWRASRERLLLSPPSDEVLAPVAEAAARLDQLQGAVNTGRDTRTLSAADKLFLWRMQGLLERAATVLGYSSDEEKPGDLTAEDVKGLERDAGAAESADG